MQFLDRLRILNVERCANNFKHALRDWNGLEWGGAIAGEVGELCNILKKILREEQGVNGSRVEGDKKKAVADEIADIIIYCDLLAAREGINLMAAIRSKFNETSLKVDFKEAL
jgi:NTP pyrophosphatase (non-canonical NTP hydrolase)